MLAHSHLQDLQRDRLPLFLAFCQPAGESAALNGSRPLPSSFPSQSLASAENSCEAPRVIKLFTDPDSFKLEGYMNRHKFYLMSPAYPARADQTQTETALRASPKEQEGTSCLAFEVQVNSYCHGQPLRIDRASPPILGLQAGPRESRLWASVSYPKL